MKETIRQGKVDWTGDNPFVYLKQDPAGEWSCLALYFRIVASPFGQGHAILCLENPYVQDHCGVRLGLTDNEPMSRFLVEGFVRRFGVFRSAAHAIDLMNWLPRAQFSRSSDGSRVVERGEVGQRSIALEWYAPGATFMVDVPPALSQTGEHVMFSVFQTCSGGAVFVDGTRLQGQTVERDFFGGREQSAALAHSETWLRPSGGSS